MGEDITAMERVERIAWTLLDRLEQAVKELDCVTESCREKVKIENGEKITEFQQKIPRKKGPVDRGGLKQLTGVLKDLQDILQNDPELNLREREIRLARIQKELTPETEGLRIVMEGEVEEFAG